MEKKLFTLILVVAVGILVGVGIVKKQTNEPLVRELIKGNDVIIQSQQRLEKALGSGQNFGGGGSAQAPVLLQKQVALETRIATLEAQVKSLQTQVQQAKAAGGNARQAPPPEDLSKVYDIPLDHSPVKGNKNAPVTIVEFVDFQCPFCARFHPPVTEVLNAYPDKVNYVLKNFPLSFHQEARAAAKAAFAAGEQGKYWEMADAILENGKSLNAAKFQELAQNLGLDMNKFNDDLKNKDAQWEGYIQKDMTLAGQVSVRGTPTFYLNGKKTNARDVNSFKAEIDQILNK